MDGLDKFEEISLSVKKNNFRLKNPAYDHEMKNQIMMGTMTNMQAISFIDKARSILNCDIKREVDPLDMQLMEEQQKYQLPNLEKNQRMLEWAGVNFGPGYAVFLQ